MTIEEKIQKNKYEERYKRMQEKYSRIYPLRPSTLRAWLFYYLLRIIMIILGILFILIFISSLLSPLQTNLIEHFANSTDKLTIDKYEIVYKITGYFSLVLGVIFLYIAFLCKKMLRRIFYISGLEDIMNS